MRIDYEAVITTHKLVRARDGRVVTYSIGSYEQPDSLYLPYVQSTQYVAVIGELPLGSKLRVTVTDDVEPSQESPISEQL